MEALERGLECRLLALVASDDLFLSWHKHGHGRRLWLWLWRRFWPGFWHRLSFWRRHWLWLWFWLPIRQTHQIFLHRLVTHEFGGHANRNVSGEEGHVAITRRPDAAAMFERS
jgi:hypothetical protein